MKFGTATQHAQQALACAKDSDNTGAINHYRKAIELDANQPVWVYTGLGNQLLQIKQIDNAEPVFQYLCEKYPEHPNGFVGLAMIAQRRGKWELALERWNKCIAEFPQQVQLGWRVNQGNALMEQGRFEEARILFESLSESHPGEPQGWSGLAQVAQRRQDWKSALKQWSEVVDRFPENFNAWIQQGNMLINLGQFNQADVVFTQAGEKWPASLELMQGMVRLANSQCNYPLALDRLDILLNSFPDNVSAKLQQALILARHGNFDVARPLIKEILNGGTHELISNNIIHQLFTGIQYCYCGNERIKLLEKLCTIVLHQSEKQSNVNADLIIAEICFALGNYEDLSEVVFGLNEKGVRSVGLSSLSKVVEKLHLPDFPDYFAPKIFGIGLSKTATSSLNDALNTLGFHAIHWDNPHTRGIISQEDFFLFDGFTDACIACQFELLYHTFPNSHFIYTTRSFESWTRSIATHYHKHHGIKNPAGLRAQTFKKRLNGLPGWAEMNLYAKYDTWENAYIDYDRRVRNFFKDKPPEKFLELRICDGEGWEQLCEFLGTAVPDTHFPLQNKSSFA